MSQDLEQNIAQIAGDRVHGAREITRGALAALGMGAVYSKAQTPAELVLELKGMTFTLLQSRPTMSSIANYLCRLIYDVAQRAQEAGEVRELVRFACQRAGDLAEEMEQVTVRVAEVAAGIIANDETIFTCSYSTTVCWCLEAALEEGKQVRALVAHSGPSDDGLSHGERMAEHLTLAGIPAKVVPDRAVRQRMKDATRVLVGADSVLPDGSLVNGVPTRKLALAAKALDVPFFVACETAKFNVVSALGADVLVEEGFEIVEPHLVSGIITEEGLMTPADVARRIKQMETFIRPFFFPEGE